MTRLPLTAVLLVAVGVVGPGHAAETVPEDSGTCFCLEHRSGQFLRGCRRSREPAAAPAPASPDPVAICWDAERQADSPAMSVTSEWSVILGGQGRCTRCTLGERPTVNVPRGDKDR